MKAIRYFNHYGTVDYEYSNGVTSLATDITKSIVIQLDDKSIDYIGYTIQDGQRPDQVSTQLYNTPEHYWTLFHLNPRLHNGLEGWPLSSAALTRLSEDKFNNRSFLSASLYTVGVESSNKMTDLPLLQTDYANLDVYTYDENDSPPYSKTDIIIEEYDVGKCGFTLLVKDSSDLNSLLINNENLGTSTADESGSVRNIALVPKEGFEHLLISAADYVTDGMIIVSYNAFLSYEEVKNSPYEHYILDLVNSQVLNISTYQVLNDLELGDGDGLLANRISREEDLKLLNDEKETIIVAHPDSIDQLSTEFTNLIAS